MGLGVPSALTPAPRTRIQSAFKLTASLDDIILSSAEFLTYVLITIIIKNNINNIKNKHLISVFI